MKPWHSKALIVFLIVFLAMTAMSLANNLPYTGYPLEYPYNIGNLNYLEDKQDDLIDIIFLQLGISTLLIGSAVAAYGIWERKRTQSVPKMIAISALGTALAFLVSLIILFVFTHVEDFNGLFQFMVLLNVALPAFLVAVSALVIQKFQHKTITQRLSRQYPIWAIGAVVVWAVLATWDYSSCGTEFGIINKFNGDCLAQKAIQQQDSTICEKADNTYREQSACYLYLAALTKDSSQCEQIPNRKLQATCLEESI